MRSVSFAIVPIFKREDFWEEAKITSLKMNFIGPLLATSQLFVVKSQLKPKVNSFNFPSGLQTASNFSTSVTFL